MASEKECAVELSARIEEKLAKGYRVVEETDVRPPDSVGVASRNRRSLAMGRSQSESCVLPFTAAQHMSRVFGLVMAAAECLRVEASQM